MAALLFSFAVLLGALALVRRPVRAFGVLAAGCAIGAVVVGVAGASWPVVDWLVGLTLAALTAELVRRELMGVDRLRQRILTQSRALAREQAKAGLFADVNRETTELVAFTKSVAGSFCHVADQASVTLGFQSRARSLEAEVDHEKLTAALRHCIDAVIAAAPTGAQVKVHLKKGKQGGVPSAWLGITSDRPVALEWDHPDILRSERICDLHGGELICDDTGLTLRLPTH